MNPSSTPRPSGVSLICELQGDAAEDRAFLEMQRSHKSYSARRLGFSDVRRGLDWMEFHQFGNPEGCLGEKNPRVCLQIRLRRRGGLISLRETADSQSGIR